MKGLKQKGGPFTCLLVSIFCRYQDKCKINLLSIEQNIFIKLELAGVWETITKYEKWIAGTGVESFLYETGNV